MLAVTPPPAHAQPDTITGWQAPRDKPPEFIHLESVRDTLRAWEASEKPQDATRSIPLRLARLKGVLEPGEVSSGGADLHPTVETMRRAHGVL